MGKIYIKSITDLNEYLGKQPEIKTAIEKLNKRYPKNSKPKKIKSADGVTKDLAFAMGVDKRVAELVKVTRRVVECRSDAKKILTRHVKSGKRRIDHESGFTKKWGTIEKDYKTMIRLTNELVAENPIIDAITTATSDITNTHAFANPALLPREYSATAKHIGMDLHQQANLYRYYYVPKQSEINKKIVHGNFRTGFTKKTKFVDKSIFPFAPNHFIRGDQSTSVDNIKLQILEAQYTIVMLTLTLNIMYETIKQNWFNVLLLCVLWLIANEIEHERWVRQHALTGLEEQLQVAERNLQDEQIIISETKEETPQATAKAYGNTIGNMSRSKLELYLPNCQFVHLIAPKNIQIFNSLEEGRSMGLDNCYYCIGDSRR